MSETKMHLTYKEFCPVNPPVILLHGSTSSKETWEKCAKTIANRTGSKVYAYDARNHGDSDWSETHSYSSMADDLVDFMDSMGIPKAVVVGHSMGGKSSMNYALRFPEKVHCLIIEDITLIRTPGTKEIVFFLMNRMKQFLNEIPPNTELEEAKRLAAHYLTGRDLSTVECDDGSSRHRVRDGSDLPLKLKSGSGFEWKTNIEVIEDSIKNDTMGPVTTDGIYHGPVLVLYGTKSPYKVLDGKDTMLKYFPNSVYAPVEGRSHWLHVDFPDQFNDLACDFIIKHRK